MLVKTLKSQKIPLEMSDLLIKLYDVSLNVKQLKECTQEYI
jgi:hypothetical protein